MQNSRNFLGLNKKKFGIIFVFLDILFAATLLLALYCGFFNSSKYTVSIMYGEEHSESDYAQIYYATSVKDMSESQSAKAYFEGNVANIDLNLSLSDINNNVFRIDPINALEVYSIKKVSFVNQRGNRIEIMGENFDKYISSRKEVEYEMHNDGLYVTALTTENQFVLSQKFNQKIVESFLNRDLKLFYFGVLLYILFGIAQIKIYRKEEAKGKNKFWTIVSGLLSCIIVSLGGALIYGQWYMQKTLRMLQSDKLFII